MRRSFTAVVFAAFACEHGPDPDHHSSDRPLSDAEVLNTDFCDRACDCAGGRSFNCGLHCGLQLEFCEHPLLPPDAGARLTAECVACLRSTGCEAEGACATSCGPLLPVFAGGVCP